MHKTVHSQKWPIQALQSPQGLLCPQGLRRSPCQQATSSQPSDILVQMKRKTASGDPLCQAVDIVSVLTFYEHGDEQMPSGLCAV